MSECYTRAFEDELRMACRADAGRKLLGGRRYAAETAALIVGSLCSFRGQRQRATDYAIAQEVSVIGGGQGAPARGTGSGVAAADLDPARRVIQRPGVREQIARTKRTESMPLRLWERQAQRLSPPPG